MAGTRSFGENGFDDVRHSAYLNGTINEFLLAECGQQNDGSDLLLCEFLQLR